MTIAELVPPENKEKPKKAAKKPTVRRSKFKEMYPDELPITILVQENPKKQGSKSRERFEGYTTASTVGEAIANGVTYQDIAYDVGRQFIKVG